MNKIYTLTFILFLAFSQMDAQVAPDFEVTDTHGNVHKLYENYLEQGKTVVLDLFFTNCGPCQGLAPYFEEAYQEWGAGQADVEFISLTSDPADNDAAVLAFEETYGVTNPAVSADGGGPEAQQPYTTGEFGQFFGYPTLIVIAPDGSIQFDAWGSNFEETITILNEWITNTGATGEITSSINELSISGVSVYPNPVNTISQVSLELLEASQVQLELFNNLGQKVRSVFNGHRNAGQHSFDLDAYGLENGNYILEIRTQNSSLSRTISVLR